MICAACQTENEAGAEVCFHCRAVLTAVTKGSVIGGRYEVLATLGRGGMGVVYQALDRVLDEVVALKLLRPDVGRETELARRFRSEIKLARRVTHRNVCRIHEYGEDGALRFISMEYVEGTDLKRVLRDGPLSPRDAFDVVIQAAQGLEAIHEAGIIHRDLKGPNIMRDGRGVVRLMDFGIAKQEGSDATGTATGQVVGTPEYMSPEQARGHRADARSDVYALGVVAFELFTGRVPFKGETPMATLFMHVQEPPPLEGPASARLPSTVLPVLHRALAKDPADRYPNARELCEALRSARQRWEENVPTPVPGATEILPAAPSSTRVPLSTPTPPRRDGAPAAASEDATTAARVPPTALSAPRGRPRSPAPKIAAGAALAIGAGALAAVWLSRDPVTTPSTSPPPSVTAPPAPVVTPHLEVVAATGASPLNVGSAEAAVPTTSPARVPVRRPPTEPPPRASRQGVPAAPSAPPTPATTDASAVQRDAAPSALPTPAAAPTPFSQPPASVAAAAPLAEEGGFLQIVVVPFAELSIDDRPAGRVSSSKIPMKAGSHTLVLNHPEYRPLRRKVTIAPGETFRLIVDLAEEAIRLKK